MARPTDGGLHMSTGASTGTSGEVPEVGTIDMKLEVVTLPVSDVDRAKGFYQSLGWRLDADLVFGDDVRGVQLTPPHSGCSVSFGKGLTTAEPGSAQRLELVVSDIEAAREDLISRGVEVSELFHRDGGELLPGPDPERRSYLTYASFSDPDGNGWLLQEVRERLPGREWEDDMDVASLADRLHETAEHHGSFEAVAPPHDWWDWYAAYMDARRGGSTPDEASAAAGRFMAEAKQIVVSTP
jgi:catechol 2,3-dioxygenase-like lactoylglutathione lyase family enzyme